MENQTSRGKTLTIVITVILTTLIVGGGVYLWQQPADTTSDVDTQQPVEQPADVVVDTQQKATLEVGPITLEDTQAITTCETTEVRPLPNEEIQQQLGINSLLNDGYKMVDICREENTVALLLAKKEPNLLFEPLEGGVCHNACDRIAYGAIDLAQKKSTMILSEHRLGIYGEAYNQFCRIDTIEMVGAAFPNTLYFYCGSPEDGSGFGMWYTLNFDNSLTVVQRMNGITPESFDVKDPELLKRFRYTSNAEIFKDYQ